MGSGEIQRFPRWPLALVVLLVVGAGPLLLWQLNRVGPFLVAKVPGHPDFVVARCNSPSPQLRRYCVAETHWLIETAIDRDADGTVDGYTHFWDGARPTRCRVRDGEAWRDLGPCACCEWLQSAGPYSQCGGRSDHECDRDAGVSPP